MIEIDGSRHSGSGTLLRYSVALSTLLGEPLHMVRIRARRDKPGLRPQHMQAIRACAFLCGGRLDGAEVGSQEITYRPGSDWKHGDFRWDIGTAGSTTMLAFTLIPVMLFCEKPCRFSIQGGLFQDFAPSAFHMQRALLPLLERMGVDARLEIVRPGYVPQGQGSILLEVSPLASPLKPLEMIGQGKVRSIRGISLSSHLEKERVSERMAEECRKLLARDGFRAEIEVVHDSSAVQKGAALFVRAETETGAILGADQAGRPGRRSESIAAFVARSIVEDLRSAATTDRHLADQLILFAALAKGPTTYLIPTTTDHVHSNLWLVEEMLGARSRVEGLRVTVDGVGLSPSST